MREEGRDLETDPPLIFSFLLFRPFFTYSHKNAQDEKQTDTNWHNIVAWGKTAEIIEKYTQKGKEIAVVGKLKTRSYEAEDTSTRYITEVVADEILLLGSKSGGNTTDI